MRFHFISGVDPVLAPQKNLDPGLQKTWTLGSITKRDFKILLNEYILKDLFLCS